MLECGCKKKSSSCTSLSPQDPFVHEKDRPVYDQDPDYHEHYVEGFYNEITLEPDVDPCGSTPSLPSVQVFTDRCEGRIEIPWLQITLPPAESLKIRSKKIQTKKTPCTCWRNKQDVIEIEADKTIQVPDTACKCINTQKQKLREEKDKNVEEKINDVVDKTKNDESNKNYEENKQDSDSKKSQDKEKSTEGEQQQLENEEGLKNEEESKNEGESKNEELKNEESKNEESKNEEKSENEKLEDEEKPSGEEEEERKVEEQPQKEFTPLLDEIPSEKSNQEDYQQFIQGKFKESTPIEELSINEEEEKCLCHDFDDPCKDIKDLKMIFNNPCYSGHEPYMDPIYNLFPDDCDTNCGPYTEIPWEDLLIPKNIKLKGVIRKKKDCNSTTCEKKNNFDDFGDFNDFNNFNDSNSMALVKVDDKNQMVCPQNDQKTCLEKLLESFQSLPKTCACFENSKTCACFEKSKKIQQISSHRMPKKSELKSLKSPKTSKTSKPKEEGKKKNLSKGAEIMEALNNCQAEMEPIKSALTDLKAKITALRNQKDPKISKDISCSCAFPPFPSFPFPPPPPISNCPFLPPPPPLPQFPPLQFDFSKPLPCNLRNCSKCKRKKMGKNNSYNSSSNSEKDSKSRRHRRRLKEKGLKKKNCRCGKKIAEKMTNTRRREKKSCGKFGGNFNQELIVGGFEIKNEKEGNQSCKSAGSGGKIIIEECE